MIEQWLSFRLASEETGFQAVPFFFAKMKTKRRQPPWGITEMIARVFDAPLTDRINKGLCFAGALLFLVDSEPVFSHAFGEAYKLPLPLSFYLSSAGIVVGLSFLLLAFFSRGPRSRLATVFKSSVVILRRESSLGRFFESMSFIPKFLSVALLFLVLYAGLYGRNETYRNIAPLFVWVVWWVGFSLCCAFFGNIWPVIDPWRNVARVVAALFPRRSRPLLTYPDRLGVWPVVGMFLVFSTMELIWKVMDIPRVVGAFVLLFSIYTWLGYLVFGMEEWLRKADLPGKLFETFAQIAPLTCTQEGLRLGFPGSRALSSHSTKDLSGVVFLVLLLSAVSFDGILELIPQDFYRHPAGEKGFGWFPNWSAVESMLFEKLVQLILYAATFFLWLFSFWGVNLLSANLVSQFSKFSSFELVKNGVVALIPIAVAYHFAHYLGYLLITGQYLLALASDPFGYGWNIFGTRDYQNKIDVITAQWAWYLSLAVIVGGHILSLCIAQLRFSELIPRETKRIFLAHLPQVMMMIVYTVIGLWLLAQPLTQ